MKKFVYGTIVCLISVSLVACNSTNEEEAPVVEEGNDVVEEENEENVEEAEGIGHHHELPYEWGGSFELEEGTYTLKFKQNDHGDEHILIAFIIENSNIADPEHHAAHMMEEDAPHLDVIEEGEQFEALHEYTYLLGLNPDGESTFSFTITQAGSYRIFTEHLADELGMHIFNEEGNEIVVTNPVEYDEHDHDHE